MPANIYFIAGVYCEKTYIYLPKKYVQSLNAPITVHLLKMIILMCKISNPPRISMILIYELREFTGLFIEIPLGNVQSLVCKAQKMTMNVYSCAQLM